MNHIAPTYLQFYLKREHHPRAENLKSVKCFSSIMLSGMISNRTKPTLNLSMRHLHNLIPLLHAGI